MVVNGSVDDVVRKTLCAKLVVLEKRLARLDQMRECLIADIGVIYAALDSSIGEASLLSQ